MADYDREDSAESEVFNPAAEIDEDDEPASRPAPRRPAAQEDEDEDDNDALGLTGNPDEDEEGEGVDLDNDDDDEEDEEDEDEDDVVVGCLELRFDTRNTDWHRLDPPNDGRRPSATCSLMSKPKSMKKTRRRKRATTMESKTCTPMTSSSPRAPNSTTATIASWTCAARPTSKLTPKTLPGRSMSDTSDVRSRALAVEELAQFLWRSPPSTIP
jgi:hypothetical protein